MFDGPGILIEPIDGIVGTGTGVGPVGNGIFPDWGSNGKILSFGRIGLNQLWFFCLNRGMCACTILYLIVMHLYFWYDSITHLS